MEERHQAILILLAQNGSITNAEIQEQFGISYDSAKRDLRILEEKGLLKRTHGGAIPNRKIGFDGGCAPLSGRERVPEVKPNYLRIAKRAIAEIRPKDVVYLTGASIGYLIARNLPADLVCTIVTSSIAIAEELRRYETITVLVTGGEMSRNGSFYDDFTIGMINRLQFDKCFLTSACLSSEFGLSVQKTRNLGLVNAVLAHSKKKYGLYPAEKIGFDSIVSICPADRLDMLITDGEALEEDLAAFDELGIEVIVAEEADEQEETG